MKSCTLPQGILNPERISKSNLPDKITKIGLLCYLTAMALLAFLISDGPYTKLLLSNVLNDEKKNNLTVMEFIESGDSEIGGGK